MVVKKELIPALAGQMLEGASASPRGGVEVGGLLFGPLPGRGGGLVVDEAVPVSIEYRYGPTFQASDADLDSITQAVRKARDQDRRCVVGFYRSRTRGEAELRESDQAILRAIEQVHRAFEAEFRAFLLLTPISRLTTGAALLVRAGDAWQPAGEATFGNAVAAFLANGETPETTAPVPEDAPAMVTRPKHSWPYIGVAALAVAGFYLLARSPAPPRAVPAANVAVAKANLGFSAVRAGGDWKLTWNRDALAAIAPSGGMLVIRDGIAPRELPLSPDDLATGTILYHPQSRDLMFLLRVSTVGTKPVEERIRVLDGTPADPVVAEETVPKPAPPPPPEEPLPRAVPNAHYTPPIAIAEATAPVPVNAHAAGVSEVQVRVHVDRRGKVYQIEPIARTELNGPWMDSAMMAAKFWRFRPARDNGRAVSSETVLTFQFPPR